MGDDLRQLLDACKQSGLQEISIPIEVLKTLNAQFGMTSANFEYLKAENVQLKAQMGQLQTSLAQALARANDLEAEKNLLMLQTQSQALDDCAPGSNVALGKRTSEGDHCAHKRYKHSATAWEVYNAFADIKPILGIEGWKFADKDTARLFWQSLLNMDVYLGICSMELRMKSARKTLNALGYSDSFSPDKGSAWTDSLTWRWNYKRALKNCYWLKTTYMLDPLVKTTINVLGKAWTTLADDPTIAAAEPTDTFLHLTAENVEEHVQRLFAFAKNKDIKFELRKMNEVVAICQHLKLFWHEKKIEKIMHFVPKIDPDHAVYEKLVSGTLQ